MARLSSVIALVACAACVVIQAAFAGPAHGSSANALYLTWNDCAGAPGAASGTTVDCGTGQGRQLIVAFDLAQPVDSVIALEAVVDMQLSVSQPLPWWQFDPGGCHYGRLIASATFPDLVACADFWNAGATFDGPPAYYLVGTPGAENRARIVVGFAVLSNQPRALAAATRYYAARLAFQDDARVICTGCEQPACLLLQSIRLIRYGTLAGDVVIDAAGGAGLNQVGWQSTNSLCGIVPTRRHTWGQLKSLYR
jgi:hypothetical protein